MSLNITKLEVPQGRYEYTLAGSSKTLTEQYTVPLCNTLELFAAVSDKIYIDFERVYTQL